MFDQSDNCTYCVYVISLFLPSSPFVSPLLHSLLFIGRLTHNKCFVMKLSPMGLEKEIMAYVLVGSR